MNTAIIAATSSLNISSQNLDECVKTTIYFSKTMYTNICNGNVASVPNGIFDFIFFTGLITFLELVVISLVAYILSKCFSSDY